MTITQKPFHESIVDTIKQMNPMDVMSFVTICKLISSTKVPRDHEVIEDALGQLAENGGHQFIHEFLDAIRALQLGAEEEAERLRCDKHGTLDCSCPTV